jgi:hypothetical protein
LGTMEAKLDGPVIDMMQDWQSRRRVATFARRRDDTPKRHCAWPTGDRTSVADAAVGASVLVRSQPARESRADRQHRCAGPSASVRKTSVATTARSSIHWQHGAVLPTLYFTALISLATAISATAAGLIGQASIIASDTLESSVGREPECLRSSAVTAR